MNDRRYKLAGGGLLMLRFPYKPSTITVVKRMFKGRWDKRARSWIVRDNSYVRSKLQNLGFRNADHVNSTPEVNVGGEAWPIHTPPLDPKRFPLRVPEGQALRPYQRDGVLRIEAFKGRCLLADEMGLGKTVQALVWLASRKDLRPVVVVTPASVKLQWEDACHVWLNEELDVVVLQGKTASARLPKARVYVVNYDILHWWVEVLLSISPQAVIADECQYVKNDGAQRSIAFRALCADVGYVVAMSGTPILNNPMELWNTLSILRPDVFQNKQKFGVRFCNPQVNEYTGAMEFKGSTNPEELHRLLLGTCMVRRLKADVLTELPAKQYIPVPLEMRDRREYDAIRDGALEDGKPMSQVLASVNALRQVAALASMPHALEWVRDFLSTTDRQLLVFGRHKAVLEGLHSSIGGSGLIYGSTTAKQRDILVKRFTTKRLRVLVGEFTAMGVGLNLQTASDVAFIEFPWTPGEMQQCEDRVHRIGQTAERVSVWLLYARGTVHEHMARVLAEKKRTVADVLDGRAITAVRKDVLRSVLLRL